MKYKWCIGASICFIYVSMIVFVISSNIGMSPNKARHLYNKYYEAFASVENIIDDVPPMTITMNNDNFDDGRTNTYIGDMKISTYRIELSDYQKEILKSTQLSTLLKIPYWKKAYFDSVIIGETSAVFRIFSILGSEGIAYFKNGNIDNNIIIDESVNIGLDWYYIKFHS